MKTILKVTDVTIQILKTFPPILTIDSTGEVISGDWSNGQLIPHIYIVPPADGIYGFDFAADEPNGPATTVISTINAEQYKWEDFPLDLKGVRINASLNSKTKRFADRNIGNWDATIKNEGKTPQIIVNGQFPTRGQKPGYHLIKKSSTDNELILTLVFGSLVNEHGSVWFHANYDEAIGNEHQYKSVLVYDDSETPRLLATIEVNNISNESLSEDNELSSDFVPYLEIIKGIELYRDSLKIRVPSGGLTDKESFYIEIIKGFTGIPPYILRIHRIKPDFGKAFFPDGIELSYTFDELDLDLFSTFILDSNYIG